MPFYSNGTRVNLNSASSLYSPADSDGAACNLTGTGTATPFYANGTQIYYSTAEWHTVWTGSTTYAAGIKTGTLTASDTLKTSYKYRITATCSGTTNTSSEETGSAILSWSGSDRFGNWTAELTVTPTNNSTTLNINKTGTHDGLGTSAVPAVTLTKVEAYY